MTFVESVRPQYFGFVGLVLGVGFMVAYYQVPNKPDQYVVTAKTRCLTKDGVPLRLSYNGKGTVDILVVPPTDKPGEKPEKETK